MRANDDPASIESQPPKLARCLWGARSLVLARRGEINQATQSAETLRSLAPDDVECLGIVARTYALCLKAGSDSTAETDATGQG